MPLSSTITAGALVTYQGDEYKVRSVEGNVLELSYDTGGFFRLVHVSSVTVCPTSATQTAASLPAPAAGQGAGTFSQWLIAERDAALSSLRSPAPQFESLSKEVIRCAPFLTRIKACELALALYSEFCK